MAPARPAREGPPAIIIGFAVAGASLLLAAPQGAPGTTAAAAVQVVSVGSVLAAAPLGPRIPLAPTDPISGFIGILIGNGTADHPDADCCSATASTGADATTPGARGGLRGKGVR